MSRRSPQSQRQNLLIELGRRVACGDQSTVVLAWICRRLIQILGVDHCRVVEQLPGSGDLLLRASAGWSIGEVDQAVLPLAADAAAAAALQSGQSVIASHTGEGHGGAGPAPSLLDDGLCVSVPIMLPRRMFGLLVVVSVRRHTFSRSDLSFLQLVAELLGGLTARRLQLRIESIVLLSRSLRQAATRAAMPSRILAHVGTLIRCAGGAILLIRASGEVSVALAEGVWSAATGMILHDEGGVSGEVIRDGVPFLDHGPTEPVDFATAVPLERNVAVACIPLLFSGRAIGALWVACPVAITHDDLELLMSVSDIAATALYRADLSEQTIRLFHEHQQLSEELRRAERHLTSIVESASDLVISADVAGRIVTWNRAAERVSGYAKEQVIGHYLGDYCAPDDRPLMENLLRGFSLGPQQGQIDELGLVSATGQRVPIAWRFSPLQNDRGEVTGIVAVGRDLVEQRRLESQLFQAAKMASMGVMASGIGHELRNPLGIISASAQIAQAHPEDRELVNTCMQRVHSATKRAALIIDNLLTFAQPGGEDRRAVMVNEVLTATVGLLEHQIRQRQIDLHTRFEPRLASVMGNPALLQQVFTNLILNACQAMASGGTLWVATSMVDSESVEVAVCDEGCGISAEVLPHIFEPFFTTRPVGQGTGLGLAISYSIVQQHCGQIEVYSTPGAGSTFVVRLPAAAIAEPVGA